MRDFVPITDAQLAQAREDPAFRRQVIGEQLAHLLAALNLLRASGPASNPQRDAQIREGIALAMSLSNILHRLGEAAAAASAGEAS